MQLARPKQAAGLQLSLGGALTSNRCLSVADGFYEFTDPAEQRKKRKDKWLFTKRDQPIFCIAGIWRKEVGEAFTMLTMEPGPDIARYQIGRSSSSKRTPGLIGSTLQSPQSH
jgi:putative SOS response-associated peptidase YedK